MKNMLYPKILSILVFVFLCTSCSSSENKSDVSINFANENPVITSESHTQENTPTLNQPQPVRPKPDFPGFVTGMTMKENQLQVIDDNICIQIEQKPLWRPGNYWDDSDVPIVHIFINETEVKDLRRALTGVLQIESDKKGEVIGMHGFGIETCIKLSKLHVKNTNNILIEVIYKDDVLLSTSWTFYIIN